MKPAQKAKNTVNIDKRLDLAEEALEDGDLERTLDLCYGILHAYPDHSGANYVCAEALRSMGEIEEAEDRYRQVIRSHSEHSFSWSGLGLTLFDQMRLAEARSCAYRSIRVSQDNAQAYYLRAIIREREGNSNGAKRDYTRAFTLEPERFPIPTPLTDDGIEKLVFQALQLLHTTLQEYMYQVAVLIQEVPGDEVCVEYTPALSPAEILGHFSGLPMSFQSVETPWSLLPPTLVLFRKNLERLAGEPEKLVEELRLGVFQDVARYLGIQDTTLSQTP